jgi:hypothetical protein
MITLYNITNEQKALLAKIEANEGELTPEILERIEITEELFHSKAADYGYVIKTFEDTSSVIDKEIKRLQELKKKADNNAERLKQRIKDAMIQFGYEKVETPTITLSFRKSESVEITDESLISNEYMRFKSEPDKTEIKKALKEGKSVHGAMLIENKNLQIK